MSHPDPSQRTITTALADFNMPSTVGTLAGVVAKQNGNRHSQPATRTFAGAIARPFAHSDF